MTTIRHTRKSAENPPKAKKIDISVVVFDVEFSPLQSDFSAEEALLQVFAFTKAVQLRENTRAHYQSGDYDQKRSGVWSGRIELQVASQSATTVLDKAKGYQFIKVDRPVLTSESVSFYAYSTKNGVIAYRDRAWLPYTRLRSYVHQAVKAFDGPRFKLDIVPRLVERKLSEWFQQFTELKTVTAEYRHSQSPGNRIIDKIITKYHANHARESYTAKKNQSLDVEALQDKDFPLSNIIDHIDQNPNNGSFTLQGRIGKDEIILDTSKPVERYREQTGNDPDEITETLTRVAQMASGKAHDISAPQTKP